MSPFLRWLQQVTHTLSLSLSLWNLSFHSVFSLFTITRFRLVYIQWIHTFYDCSTATKKVQDDVINSLRLKSPSIFICSFNRVCYPPSFLFSNSIKEFYALIVFSSSLLVILINICSHFIHWQINFLFEMIAKHFLWSSIQRFDWWCLPRHQELYNWT